MQEKCMKKKVQIEEARNNFVDLLEEAIKGREIIIMDKHKPIARLVAITGEENEKKDSKWTSEDFDIQLNDEL
jgi:antitoxin (DNA-binding transcriptional repressor) of toxin-antitoxin stability system